MIPATPYIVLSVVLALFAFWLGRHSKVVRVYQTSERGTAKYQFKPGDIVFYSNPGKRDELNNMITQVLDVHEGGGVSLRVRGNTLRGSTTGGCPLERLTLLPVDENYPLQFPGDPGVEKFSFQKSVPWEVVRNEGVWQQIPLWWFPYQLRVTTKKEVS